MGWVMLFVAEANSGALVIFMAPNRQELTVSVIDI